MAFRNEQSAVNPLAIRRINLEKLFGVYSYSIPDFDSSRESESYSKLLLLYGDNGSGKTTILRLVFHLLSPEDRKGHRTFLAETIFRRFEVELANGINVSASRDNERLVGSYELSISMGHETMAKCACVTDESLQVVESEGLENFLQCLRQLDLAIYFLADDRKIARSVSPARTREEELMWRRRVVLEGHAEDSEESRQDANVKSAVQRVTQWIRQQVLKGASIGQDNSNTIYAHVVKQIVSEKTASTLDVKATSVSMINTIEELAARNNLFAEYGLVATMNAQSFTTPLRAAQKGSSQLMTRILQPYFDGITARLDALEGIYSLVRLFVTNMNSFYTGKCVQFSLQTGLAVFSGGGTRLKLNMLSSGEKQLLLLFCNTLIARDRSAIFIIDEPELSLNVKWQRRLVKALLDCIEGSNIQFLLATHSLEILALHRNNVAKLVNASPEGSK